MEVALVRVQWERVPQPRTRAVALLEQAHIWDLPLLLCDIKGRTTLRDRIYSGGATRRIGEWFQRRKRTSAHANEVVDQQQHCRATQITTPYNLPGWIRYETHPSIHTLSHAYLKLR